MIELSDLFGISMGTVGEKHQHTALSVENVLGLSG